MSDTILMIENEINSEAAFISTIMDPLSEERTVLSVQEYSNQNRLP